MPHAYPTTVNVDQGGTLSNVHGDHSVDVWEIPEGSTVTIQPAAGFGNVTETSQQVSKADAESDIDTQLDRAGAQ